MNLDRFLIRIAYAKNRFKDQGIFWSLKELIYRTGTLMGWLFFLPFTLLLHLLGFRRLPIFTDRIGHLASEMDCFLKLKELGQIDTSGKRFFVLAPSQKVSNACLLNYWRSFITIIDNPIACWFLEVMTQNFFMRFEVTNYVLAIGGAAQYYEVQAKWADRMPLLTLNINHKMIGDMFLEKVGIPPDAWIVCVHAREGAFSPKDESVHQYRNMSINSMLPAIKEIIARGGWCIRMGDSKTIPLSPMNGCFDYAHFNEKSDELDIYLCARCSFFLGDSSGLFIVSSIFGKPSALTNQIPFASTGFSPKDICIPKLLRKKDSTEFISSKEILNSELSNFRMTRMYIEAQIEWVNNSSDEIRDLVLEMMDFLDGNYPLQIKNDLMEDGFFKHLKPWHYCYKTSAKISPAFVNRHKFIFQS